MDSKAYQHITVDSKKRHLKDWAQTLNKEIVWQKDIINFIENWLDESDTIEVQTSGSTGQAKVISIQKNLMLASAKATLNFFKLSEGQTALLCLPVKYIAGKMMLVRAILGKLNLILVEPSSVPCEQLDSKIDFAAMIPLQVENSLHALSKIQNLIIGGAPMSPSLENRLKKAPNSVYASYGMTETITHVALRNVKEGVYFKALPGVTFWQDDRDCLIVKAPHLNIDELITNDVIELEDFTHFKWLGRYDNVINSGGIKLNPEEIESKIAPLFDRAFYISSEPDELLGEKLILLIEGDELDAYSLTLLKSELAEELNKYEVPKKIVFAQTFNRTPNGKLKRSEHSK